MAGRQAGRQADPPPSDASDAAYADRHATDSAAEGTHESSKSKFTPIKGFKRRLKQFSVYLLLSKVSRRTWICHRKKSNASGRMFSS